jgi:hypothetical protein
MSGAVRVFLSSTAADLREYRDRVQVVLEQLDATTCRMEVFGARPETPVSVCERFASDCDALVVIVAHRYGWVPTVEQGGDGAKSITWLEVQAAIAAKKPVFAFLVDEAFTWGQSREQDRLTAVGSAEEAAEVWQRVRLLKEFKDLLSNGRIRQTFTTVQDLAEKVATSLGRWLLERGNVRPADTGLDAYLGELISCYHGQEWTRQAINLNARRVDGVRVVAYEQLMRWATGEEAKALFLVGDFGSGKTGLVQRLAADLAVRASTDATAPLPVFVVMQRARRTVPRSTDDIRTLTEPTAPPAIFERNQRDGQRIVILDGLDELLDPTNRAPTPYSEVVSALCRLMPEPTRFLVTCRGAAFEPVSAELDAAFHQRTDTTTDNAIAQALGVGVQRSAILTLCDLDPTQGDEYLGRTHAAPFWEAVHTQPAFQHLARQPFTLRLLEKALPNLATSTRGVDLAELYRVAIVSWIMRDSLSSRAEVDRLMNKLQDMLFGASPLDRDDDDVARFVRCGLLKRVGGELRLAHYSFDEYFVARRLHSELARYDAGLLARLNLIGAYNINRMLVPLLWRSFREKYSGPQAEGGAVRVVTRGEYGRFVAATGWRGGVGHGRHPNYHAADGTAYLSAPGIANLKAETPGNPLSGNDAQPVTSVSWYDAVEYCVWCGRKLLNRGAIESLPGEIPWAGPAFVWGWDWFDEVRAHMSVGVVKGDRTNAQVVGVNPDFRHRNLGFCVR